MRGDTKSPNRQRAAASGASGDNQERKCQRKSQSVRGGARRKLHRIVVTLLGLVLPQLPPPPGKHTRTFQWGSRQAADSAAFKINSIEIFFFLSDSENFENSPRTLVHAPPPSQPINDIAAFCLLFRLITNKKKTHLKTAENCSFSISHFPFSFSFSVGV